jgi:hypothetical protein
MRILHRCRFGVRVWIYKPVQDDKGGKKAVSSGRWVREDLSLVRVRRAGVDLQTRSG